jgi:hypothetical protein
MSHRHGDHMGGLAYLLKVNPKVKIYAPHEGFSVYGADLLSSFYRKDPSLPSEQCYYGGEPPDVMRFGSAWPGANFQLMDKTVEIDSDIYLISLVSDKPKKACGDCYLFAGLGATFALSTSPELRVDSCETRVLGRLSANRKEFC